MATALAVAMVGGLAGTASAAPVTAPDQLFSLNATHYKFGEHWCTGTSNLCLYDTASPSFAGTWGDTATILTASGAHGPNVLKSEFHIQPEAPGYLGEVQSFHNAMFDTYTLSGPAGPVDITLTLHLTGNIAFTGTSNTGYAAAEYAVLAGSRKLDHYPGARGSSGGAVNATLISVFGRASTYTSICVPYPNCPLGPVDVTASSTFTVTPGTPFEIGYDLYLTGADAAVDFGHSLLIDFALPDGYSLSSALGWTDPDLPASGIPAPAGLPLLATGLVLMAALRRPPA